MQKSDKRIAIIGFGYVGKAAYRMVKNHYQVSVYDPNLVLPPVAEMPENSEWFKDLWPEHNFSNCDLAIVCVPTPMSEDDKRCMTDLVEEVIAKLDSKLILIKSTIAPGTLDRVKFETGKHLVFSPEYIGESTYNHPYNFQTDMAATPFMVLGGDKKDTAGVLDILVPILGPTKTYYQVTGKEAEVIKYMENTYFGVKVTFANEMKKICDALGVDYYSVRTGWALDPRVDNMHTMVFPGKPGFGGKCLPKDLNALVAASRSAGYDPKFLAQMLASNDEYRAGLVE